MVHKRIPAKKKANQSEPRILTGIPDIQKQLLLIDRLAARAPDVERETLDGLAGFLSELYSQLQHQKSVRVYRLASKMRSVAD